MNIDEVDLVLHTVINGLIIAVLLVIDQEFLLFPLLFFWLIREIYQHYPRWWESFTRVQPCLEWTMPAFFTLITIGFHYGS